ncbi:MAG: ABC transporter permease [Spirochaetota bacterium]
MNNYSAAPVIEKYNRRIGLILARNWALFFLFLSITVFSFTGTNFLALNNFQNIIHLSVVFLLLASAETFVIITGGIDLSIGFVMGLSSVLSATVMKAMHAGLSPQVLSILGGCIVGIAVSIIPGLINGTLITRFRVPPFIATLGMWGVTNGVTLRICQGFPVSFLPPKLVEIGNGYLIYILPGKSITFFNRPAGSDDSLIREFIRVIPNSFIFLIIVVGILLYLLKNTKFGQHTYAIGGSMDAAVRSGINVNGHLLKIYVLSSFLAGLAGVFNVFQTGTGNFTPFNAMYELFAIAAVVIGGASLMGGKGRLFGSFIGVILIGVLENGLSLSGVEPFYRFIAVGLILIIAVVIDQLFPDLF